VALNFSPTQEGYACATELKWATEPMPGMPQMKAHSEHESVARVLVARCTLCAHSEHKHYSRFKKHLAATWLIHQEHA
jgi:hypothetical protein